MAGDGESTTAFVDRMLTTRNLLRTVHRLINWRFGCMLYVDVLFS